MLKGLFIPVIGLFIIKAGAQHVYNKDSLKREYQAETNDSIKIRKHLDYIHALLYSYDKDTATKTEIEQLEKEVSGTSDPHFIFWTLYYKGLSSYNNNEYINSIIAIEKMYRVLAVKGLPEKARRAAATALITLGLDYSMINDLENAQSSYQNAIRELEVLKDSSNLLLTYINMGYVFMKAQDWANARRIFLKATGYVTGNVYDGFVVVLYSSLAIADAKLGNEKGSSGHLLKAASFLSATGESMPGSFYAYARGEHEMLKGNYAVALDAFSVSLEKSRRWGDTSTIAESYEGLGRAYWKTGNNNLALEYLLRSKQLAVSHQLIHHEKIVLNTLFAFYKSTGSVNKALLVADTLLRLNDSLGQLLNHNRRIIADGLFDSEEQMRKITTLQKQKEIDSLQLRQKNTINYILAGSAVTLLVISLLSFRNFKQKQKLQQQKITDLEREKILSATRSLIRGQEDERNRMAMDLHDGLGGLLSGVKLQLGAMKGNLILSEEHGRIFNNALHKLDESIQEIRRVAHNLMPEALMNLGLQQALQDYCDGLSAAQPFTIKGEFHGLANRMDSSTEVVIYRIVQELLNNAVKHSGASAILAQVMRQGNQLTITVEDNGKGFELDTVTQGSGLKNIRSRVDYLKGQMDFQSTPGRGTSVHIECVIDG